MAANKGGADRKGRYQPRNGSRGSLMAHSWTHWPPFINGRYRIRTCDLLGVKPERHSCQNRCATRVLRDSTGRNKGIIHYSRVRFSAEYTGLEYRNMHTNVHTLFQRRRGSASSLPGAHSEPSEPSQIRNVPWSPFFLRERAEAVGEPWVRTSP